MVLGMWKRRVDRIIAETRDEPPSTPQSVDEGPLEAAYTLVAVLCTAAVLALLLGGVASWVSTGSFLP